MATPLHGMGVALRLHYSNDVSCSNICSQARIQAVNKSVEELLVLAHAIPHHLGAIPTQVVRQGEPRCGRSTATRLQTTQPQLVCSFVGTGCLDAG